MTRIQLRRDVAVGWSTNNPTPAEGEPCYETDTGKLKIGDGRTAYNDLAYQGGGATIDDTTTSTDSVWSSNKVNAELSNKQDTLPSTDSGYNININGSSVAGGTVYFGGNTSAFLAPHAKANTSSHILNLNSYSVGGSGFTMYDTVLKTNSFKYGNRTNQYEVVNKSPDNNTYMAHMAMPSDKYIDLELAASGTTYTAPADGWINIRRYSDATNTITSAYLSIANITSDGTVVNRMDCRAAQDDWTKQNTGLMEILMPVKKDQSYTLTYKDFSAVVNESCYFRFFYSVGSEPSS